MLCILVFIIFLLLFPILGIFPEYRKLFAKAWSCAFKKVTLKPCDINLGEEMKNKFLGKLFVRYPKAAKFFDRTFSFWAILFIIINVWSLLYMSVAALNLFVYDTCNPSTGEGCALSGDACTIGVSEKPSILETIKMIPNRLKGWPAEDYLASSATFYTVKNEQRDYILEIVDPGCVVCSNLTKNLKQTKLPQTQNLSYILYPIPSNSDDGYRFPHSFLRAQYVEAVKDFTPTNERNSELENMSGSADWVLLEILFTREGQRQDTLQNEFNTLYSEQEAIEVLHQILTEIGFSDSQIQEIAKHAQSQEIQNRLQEQKKIVEEKIQTIKIPTILIGGKRFDRLLTVEKLETFEKIEREN